MNLLSQRCLCVSLYTCHSEIKRTGPLPHRSLALSPHLRIAARWVASKNHYFEVFSECGIACTCGEMASMANEEAPESFAAIASPIDWKRWAIVDWSASREVKANLVVCDASELLFWWFRRGPLRFTGRNLVSRHAKLTSELRLVGARRKTRILTAYAIATRNPIKRKMSKNRHKYSEPTDLVCVRISSRRTINAIRFGAPACSAADTNWKFHRTENLIRTTREMNEPSCMRWRSNWNEQVIFLLCTRHFVLAMNWLCHTIAQPLPPPKRISAQRWRSRRREICSSFSLHLIFFALFPFDRSTVCVCVRAERARNTSNLLCHFRVTPFYKLAMLIPSKLLHSHRYDVHAACYQSPARSFAVVHSLQRSDRLHAPRGNVSAKLVPFFGVVEAPCTQIGNVAFHVIGFEIYVFLSVINFTSAKTYFITCMRPVPPLSPWPVFCHHSPPVHLGCIASPTIFSFFAVVLLCFVTWFVVCIQISWHGESCDSQRFDDAFKFDDILAFLSFPLLRTRNATE